MYDQKKKIEENKKVITNCCIISQNMEWLHDKLLDRIQFGKFKVIYTGKNKSPNYASHVMAANLAINNQERHLEVFAYLQWYFYKNDCFAQEHLKRQIEH